MLFCFTAGSSLTGFFLFVLPFGVNRCCTITSPTAFAIYPSSQSLSTQYTRIHSHRTHTLAHAYAHTRSRTHALPASPALHFSPFLAARVLWIARSDTTLLPSLLPTLAAPCTGTLTIYIAPTRLSNALDVHISLPIPRARFPARSNLPCSIVESVSFVLSLPLLSYVL